MKNCGFPTQRPELRGQGIGCYSCRRGTLLIVILCLGKKWFLNGANGIFVFVFAFVFTTYHDLIMINTSCVKLECVLAGIDGDTHRSHCCHGLMFNESLSKFINVYQSSNVQLAPQHLLKLTFCRSGSLPEATSVQDLIVAPTLEALNLQVPSIA